MLFDGLAPDKEVKTMSINTCKIILKNAEQTTTTHGVACTKDIELYISMLVCPR
jgi:hypothetical protein